MVDSMPIHTETLHDYTFNPKYGGPVWKVTVLTSFLGDIIIAYPFALTRHAWNGREAGGHERLAHRLRIGFLSFHLAAL